MGFVGSRMRVLPVMLAVAVLGACQPSVPDSSALNQPVGFENYVTYQRRMAEARQAQQQALAQQRYTNIGAGPAAVAAAPVAPAPSATGPIDVASVLAAHPAPGAAPAAAPAFAPAAAPVIPPVTAAPVATGAPLPATVPPAAPPVAHTGISDEQDFGAVASRETIQSDKARIEANRAQYQQIQPKELPQRVDTDATRLIQYALSAPNRRGETVYPRSKMALVSSERACARYRTPEAAQLAFLDAGGPQRDGKNLDPDGDGFACAWDPTPFQKARN